MNGAVKFLFAVVSVVCVFLMQGCNNVDNERIPNLPVNIVLADAGSWNTYGVSGFGSSRRFILAQSVREPSGFPYSQTSATGFGGVLLINGMDPYTSSTDVPLAYDLACPVEMKATVRVEVEGELYNAVCPVCGSRYDVTMGAGAPLSGPAATGDHKYGLRRYTCYSSGSGGYIITNK